MACGHGRPMEIQLEVAVVLHVRIFFSAVVGFGVSHGSCVLRACMVRQSRSASSQLHVTNTMKNMQDGVGRANLF